MKKFVSLGIAAVALGWVAWPYYTFWSLDNAIKTKDVVVLEQLVDWNAVRAGMRNDMKAAMASAISNKSASATDAAIGMGLAAALGAAFLDRVLDTYVTPQGLVSLIEDGKPVPGSNGMAGLGRGKGIDWSRIKYAFFTGPTDFRIEIAGNKPDEILTATMHWDGGWRISRIYLPLDKITKGMQ